MNKRIDKFWRDIVICALICGSDKITEDDIKKLDETPPVEKLCGLIFLYIFIGFSTITEIFYRIKG